MAQRGARELKINWFIFSLIFALPFFMNLTRAMQVTNIPDGI
jgi:hypothetical protein